MIFYSLLGLLGIFFDLILKYLAVYKLPSEGVYLLKDYIGLELYFNKNIAFSIPIKTTILYVLNFSIILVVFYMFFKKVRKQSQSIFIKYQLIGITLLLSGAIANLINRIFNGYVIDYIVIGKFPVFNLADIMIVIGTFFWLILEYYLDYTSPRSSTDRTIPS